MEKYEIGQILAKSIGHPENVQFDLDDSGAVMLVHFHSPTEKEISQFSQGNPFEIRFTPFSGVIFLTVKIGSLNWMDMPYTPHLSPNLTRLALPGEGQGLGLTLILVDTATGKIKSMRFLGLSENFTRKLFGEILEMQSKPFDHAQYNVKNQEIFSKYNTKQLVDMAAAYYKAR